MYEDFFRRRGRNVLFFRYAPPMPGREVADDISTAKQPNPPYPGAPGWRRSVYYYWWRFLRENADFKRAVQSEQIEPNTVADDFQHVFNSNFRDWWAYRGRWLFCEPPDDRLRVEAPPVFEDDPNRLLLSIPASANLETMLSDLRTILQPILAQNKAAAGGSKARYPVWTKPVVSSLHQHLVAWEVHRANPELNYIQLADEIGILRGEEDCLEVRNKKSAITSRLVKQAGFMIEQVAYGRFPVMNNQQLEAGLKKFKSLPDRGW